MVDDASLLSPLTLRLLWAATLWLPLYVFLFFVYVGVMSFGIGGLGAGVALLEALHLGETAELLFGLFASAGLFLGMVGFGLVFVVHALTMLVQIALLVIHPILAFRLPMEESHRILWVLAVVFGGSAGQIAFLWFVAGPSVRA